MFVCNYCVYVYVKFDATPEEMRVEIFDISQR